MADRVNLVKDLNADHAALCALLEEIGAEPALTEGARGLLSRLRSELLNHVSREDRDFYPDIRKAAQSKPALESVLNVMGKEMESLSAQVVATLDAWIIGENAAGFPAAFARLRGLFTERIRREERELYAKYLKLA